MKLPLIALTLLLSSAPFAMATDMLCSYDKTANDGVDYPALCDAIEQASIGTILTEIVYDPAVMDQMVFSIATRLPISYSDRKRLSTGMCENIQAKSSIKPVLVLWSDTEFLINGGDFAALMRGINSGQIGREGVHMDKCEK